MKVLQLTNKPPWPPVEGGPMAMHAVTTALLRKGFEVKILAAATPKFNIKPDDVPHEYRQKTSFETIFVNTGIKPLNVIFHLFSGKSYIVSRFVSNSFRNRLAGLLYEFRPDIVIMESLFMWRYLPTIREIMPDTKIILRAHNVEHLIWERIVAGESNLVKRLFLKYLANRLRHEEMMASSKFDGIIAITDVDADWFRDIVPHIPVISLPFGIEAGDTYDFPELPPLKIYHMGSMNWYPNIEAVEWLIQLCKEGLLNLFPQIELHLAGRNMPENFIRYQHERLKVHGEVPDSKSFVLDNHVLAAPLFSGSGIRIKILEAMALGRVVITTTIGAEGIKCTNGRDIIIADTPDDFRNAINMLLENPTLLDKIGKAAQNLIQHHYNPGKLAEQLREFLIKYEDSLSNSGV